MKRIVIAPVAAGLLALVLGLSVSYIRSGGGQSFIPQTCTNTTTHVTKTWMSLPSGWTGWGGTSTVSVTSSEAKSQPNPPIDPRTPVLSAIASGLDPVDAVRQFGLSTLEDPNTATKAEIKTALSPVTYGWENCHAA